MNNKKVEGRNQILLLVLVTLLWFTGFRSFFLPLYQQWTRERNFQNSGANQVEYSDTEISLLQDEVESLKGKLEHLSVTNVDEFSAEKLHLFLSDMTERGGGELTEIIIACQDEQDTPNINLSFVWQGDYLELRNCLDFFNTLPWKLAGEAILIRNTLTTSDRRLQLEYHCKVLARVNADFQKKEPTIFDEEAKDPFKTK